MVDKTNPDILNLEIGESIYVAPENVFYVKQYDTYFVNRHPIIENKLKKPNIIKLILTSENLTIDISMLKYFKEYAINYIDLDDKTIIIKPEKDYVDNEKYEDYDGELEGKKKGIQLVSFVNVIENIHIINSIDDINHIFDNKPISPKDIIENEFLELGIKF